MSVCPQEYVLISQKTYYKWSINNFRIKDKIKYIKERNISADCLHYKKNVNKCLPDENLLLMFIPEQKFEITKAENKLFALLNLQHIPDNGHIVDNN